MTGWSGTSATRPTRTRCSPDGATGCTPSSRTGASRPSRPARRASTTLSASGIRAPRSRAALGMAVAAARAGDDRRVVAVIGDGAMSAGMAFEALNHAGSLPVEPAGDPQRQRHVDLRERRRAVELSRARALGTRCTRTCARAARSVLRQMPTVRELARRSEEHLKGMVLPGTLFEEMGFNYIGPIDGHDRARRWCTRCATSRNCTARSSCMSSRARARATRPPRPTRSSGMGPDRSTPRAAPSSRRRRRGPSYSQIFGDWLCDMASRRPAHRRHHPGDARGLGTGGVLAALPGALLRRRHRRAARGDLRRRTGRRGPASPWWRSTPPSCSAPTTS